MIDFSDGTLRREQDLCRESLTEARRRFTDDQSQESREVYLQTLRTFSDFAMGKKAKGELMPAASLAPL
jgi:hypothetical protein